MPKNLRHNSGSGTRLILCPCGWRFEGDPLKMDTIVRLHAGRCKVDKEPCIPSKEKFLPQDKSVKKSVLGNGHRYVEAAFLTEDQELIKQSIKN